LVEWPKARERAVKGQPLSIPQTGGWIAERDPRLRVLAGGAFALVTVSLSSLSAVLAAFVLAAFLAGGSGLCLRGILWRLVALEGFMFVLLVTLPFTVPGDALVEIGNLTASREGLLSALLIAVKANAIVLCLMALLGGLEPTVLGHALARLGLPEKLVHSMMLTVRQIHVLNQELQRLRQAMRARAFVPRNDRHTWRSYGHLIGMMMVRSLERSRRVLGAMRCRGFQGRLYLLDSSVWRTADTALVLGLSPLLIGLLVLDVLS
jgi:cobalt/nickel transport system permease protein